MGRECQGVAGGGQAESCRPREEEPSGTWRGQDGAVPLTGVGAHGEQAPPIPREPRPHAEGLRASTAQFPFLRAQPLSQGSSSLPAPAASSYRFTFVSCQAPETPLSLKALGEKVHEKLQRPAVPTQPLTTPARQPSVTTSANVDVTNALSVLSKVMAGPVLRKVDPQTPTSGSSQEHALKTADSREPSRSA